MSGFISSFSVGRRLFVGKQRLKDVAEFLTPKRLKLTLPATDHQVSPQVVTARRLGREGARKETHKQRPHLSEATRLRLGE